VTDVQKSKSTTGGTSSAWCRRVPAGVGVRMLGGTSLLGEKVSTDEGEEPAARGRV
jgi:hypothetical protein